MKLTLIRHATLLVEMNDKKILVDPMLSPKGAMEPVQNASNNWPIPMTSLPLTEQELGNLLATADAILVTHTHRDHWDDEAQKRVPKDKLLFCQPEDEAKLKAQGFTQVQPIKDKHNWGELHFSRTEGRHGTGDIGMKMGPVSGFVLQAPGHRLYVAGDTIWCKEVQQALQAYHPDVVVVNAGAAQFLQGDPITMTGEDLLQVMKAAPTARLVAVHMDTVNHCVLTRSKLNTFLSKQQLADRCLVPADGESIYF
ncbi:L-ascorbate metabolism protein UlaG (beta-lactamase superfamily) [Pontibacter ummariensis]|uniref:L-ascorbate metabolism protein UlaG, beta-lactamase superfamily n=1 Tax=Pontibacter ummariensis TaxID=1610492 RepID=A0A239LL00_9BACT|nr:MBL fold metallo-hydrolase [Pontibacter ummariensis]PRY03130.1 L-ascorbate metabolism protein UlaG (beta-lactamase superfamily) [Pontibacter ummariensis]SNT30264.1 L-ascorbate metabolism protein UlaG, beta-lactamase superfamily [Pontibacter ummariensis]